MKKRNQRARNVMCLKNKGVTEASEGNINLLLYKISHTSGAADSFRNVMLTITRYLKN